MWSPPQITYRCWMRTWLRLRRTRRTWRLRWCPMANRPVGLESGSFWLAPGGDAPLVTASAAGRAGGLDRHAEEGAGCHEDQVADGRSSGLQASRGTSIYFRSLRSAGVSLVNPCLGCHGRVVHTPCMPVVGMNDVYTRADTPGFFIFDFTCIPGWGGDAVD